MVARVAIRTLVVRCGPDRHVVAGRGDENGSEHARTGGEDKSELGKACERLLSNFGTPKPGVVEMTQLRRENLGLECIEMGRGTQ